MCGRFAQNRKPHRYAEALGLLPEQLRMSELDEPIGRYNVAPHTPVHLLHLDNDGLRDDLVTWGWAPIWATGKHPPPFNARIETVATSNFFRSIWKTGRALIGAEGWYEWKTSPTDPKLKQPYFIRLQSHRPLFFAAIGQFPREGQEPLEGDGFVILSGTADDGLTSIHERKPIVLSPGLARAWLDPGVTSEEAEDIARFSASTADAFEWYPVSRTVGNTHNDHPGLIKPIDDPLV